MSIINKQIGWSNEANLLRDILKELDRLIKVTSSSSGGTSFTFSNGVTELSGAVKLGGNLVQNTNITGNSGVYNLSLGTSGNRLNLFSVYADNNILITSNT